MTEPPIGVKVLSILAGIGGALIILSATLVNPILTSLGVSVTTFVSTFLILLGLGYLAYAYGLWKLKTWAWWLAIILGILAISTNLAALTTSTTSLIMIVWNAAVVYYLYTRRKLFKITGKL